MFALIHYKSVNENLKYGIFILLRIAVVTRFVGQVRINFVFEHALLYHIRLNEETCLVKLLISLNKHKAN